ncbi:MAG: hypothetical protein FWE66_03495, partial [Oscillospiraceae bacterium]|nr:hypothetical protein [Oscillospiraceae bacterium]
MKRIFSIVSLLVVFVLALTACSGDPSAGYAGEDPNTGSSGVIINPDSSQNTPTSSPPNLNTVTFDTSKNISILAREDGSGTKSAFMEIIGLKGKADPDNVIIQTGTAGILTETKGNLTAIAYESLGYVTSDVKLLKVDGVEANTSNIKNGTYKISRPLSIVYKEAALDNEVNKAFFVFLQSSDAQKIISDEKYVSVID